MADTPSLDRGPKFLIAWSKGVAAQLDAIIKQLQVMGFWAKSGSPRGEGEGAGDDGGGGGGGGIETVTGAVNGAPSTLNVATDGNGWTAI